MTRRFYTLFLTLLLAFPAIADALPCTLSPAPGADAARLTTPSPGTWSLAAGGPYSLLLTPSAPPPPGATVFECEIFSLGGSPRVTALPGPPFQPATSRQLPAIGHSESWTPYGADLASAKPMPGGWRKFRLDLLLDPASTLQIRNARLRPARPTTGSKPAKDPATLNTYLDAYLSGPSPAKIEQVAVAESTLTIRGTTGGQSGDLQLAEIPCERAANDPTRFEFLQPVNPDPTGRFSIQLPRTRDRNGKPHDRLLSKWQLVRRLDDAFEPVSHAHWSDTVACRSPKLPPAKPKSKKGLGGWSARRKPDGELARLDISAITVNVMVHSLVSLKPGPDTFPITWQGRTYHARRRALESHDATFRKAAEHGAMVSTILLVANPKRTKDPTVQLLGHPDCDPAGTFAMPNVTNTGGAALYGAVLNLMAERWSRPDGKYGRVHHWIVHNEVDAGWTWTNAGVKPDIVYMDLYHRSMRMVHLITRQYDPHARAWISLTHHWAKTVHKHFYPSKRLLEILAAFCRAEGDFPWALAYHPYPQSLRKPRTWEDTQPTLSFDTPKITPRNLEVLDAFIRQKSMLYQSRTLRPVHLSENGFNSPDYSGKSLRDQAAGMAYAWKKIQRLPSIQSWQYHNWIDNRHEGGLRIGLRKFPDDKDDPLGPKPIWHLYRDLATPREDAACAPYLSVIGIKDWAQIIQPLR